MDAHGTWVLTASGPHGRVHLVVEVQAGPDGLVGVATVGTERVVLAVAEGARIAGRPKSKARILWA